MHQCVFWSQELLLYKDAFCKYGKRHCPDKIIIRLCDLHNGILWNDKNLDTGMFPVVVSKYKDVVVPVYEWNPIIKII